MMHPWPWQSSHTFVDKNTGHFRYSSVKYLVENYKKYLVTTEEPDCNYIRDTRNDFRYRVKTFPGMCGIMLAYEFCGDITPEVITDWEFFAEQGNYTKIMCSEKQESPNGLFLASHGFEPLLKFINMRTGNDVQLLVKNVNRRKAVTA